MADLNGNCFICGQTFSKTGMRTHIVKKHATDGLEKCFLVKVEGYYEKDYWLMLDIPQNAMFGRLDQFLRDIWMECCGHMSKFYTKPHNGIEEDQRFNEFSSTARKPILYDYDMGSTTRCIVTYIGETLREKQKEAARLLARNEPYARKCDVCGENATLICQGCMYGSGDSVFCNACGEKHEHNVSCCR